MLNLFASMRALRSFCLAVMLAFVFVLPAAANIVSVSFNDGIVGTLGQNTSKVDAITTFSTLGIAQVYFTQVSTSGQFGGTQGNDLNGTLRMILNNGSVIDVVGAINWRITTSGTVQYFGFIPAPGNAPQSIPWSGGNYILDGTRNYAVRKNGSTLSYVNGTSVSGNAALSGLVSGLNLYLQEQGSGTPVITGPSGGVGAVTATITLDEGLKPVATYTSNLTSTWSISGVDAARFVINPQTGALTFATAPVYDAPSDANTDNIYQVTITATGASGASSFQNLNVVIRKVVVPASVITATKSVIPVSVPGVVFDCATQATLPDASVATPGVCVEYRIDVSSIANGSAPAQNVVIRDVLPASMLLVSVRDQLGFDEVVVSSENTVTAKKASFAAGSRAFFRVRALIR
ncbi:hypothetical protein ACOI1H_16090 [Loktanella sp. DJP18]|uniref:hypothetical protein n=1 Tax=Loktanella sp. DJP18 TaxID=3409788 RepID=UPI003BB4ECCC